MAHDRHKNAHQKSQKIYQNIRHFSDNLLYRTVRINRVDYLYNLSDNIIEIDRTPYNIQQKDKHLIIVDNNGSRMNTLSPISKSAKPAITCLKELKSLKNKNVYEVVDLSKGRKAIKDCQVFNIKSDSYYRS